MQTKSEIIFHHRLWTMRTFLIVRLQYMSNGQHFKTSKHKYSQECAHTLCWLPHDMVATRPIPTPCHEIIPPGSGTVRSPGLPTVSHSMFFSVTFCTPSVLLSSNSLPLAFPIPSAYPVPPSMTIWQAILGFIPVISSLWCLCLVGISFCG